MQIKQVLNNPSIEQSQQQIIALELEEELANQEKTLFASKCLHVAARHKLEGETISKYWINVNKAKTLRDTLALLKYPKTNPPVLERNSDKMAKLARDYHYSLQGKDLLSGEEQDAANDVVYLTLSHLRK
jgi:hypothetical protein